MSTRSLNKVMLIGNLTRDPELRYTPQGTAVCTIGMATNRTWVTESGEKREETEFHRIVAWNKLAELCSQLLFKGRRVYVEGRLQTRQWTGQDGQPRQATEIVIEDMLVLDNKRQEDQEAPMEQPVEPEVAVAPAAEAAAVAEDIPF
ncbi:MAG: Single-stranded DNA-binding protein [Candidatus Amesbacteria bacterium GW2011_GWB1_47_26]|uniref:Single-stranded DNA-binding protein n=1 Tax=Candidatus Amesbacteria bacterium GW2011_GWC2_45_19 TaxID=1618366 RepID=A0A0G1M3J1_9BACT|nr:MAG: Single-stranded DNA-binding protein [Candidatus Amesbacteria bacterium GW2011_GWC2_45_19]KKU38099.1 MAG: Single-stranded DNA-binding protein [Candidatus Amesbacteria bacterium GW2011_GWA1_46_35]KKU69071.1 MAG: Single-stranded DNA-binding protein [Microgenomates group bacterium GW2011_GWC1_47_20]KKU74758.1 MAG: Single-stranded DNA-binding protein [Candidatus Amesbacteria bacterium GW2011_GWB1_47_26]KKU80189.1 MAG: Single-stranded DNA-binding protein [Candidatus Amesbacteria bacterium GW2